MKKQSSLKSTLKFKSITYVFIEQTWTDTDTNTPKHHILILKQNRGIKTNDGVFDVQEARKCYKALLKKGFKRV